MIHFYLKLSLVTFDEIFSFNHVVFIYKTPYNILIKESELNLP